MKSDRLGKHLLFAAILTLAAYGGLYQLDSWLRVRQGPWQAVFEVDAGTPTLRISHPAKGIAATLSFPGERREVAASQPVVFNDVMRSNVPFGEVIFQDLTYLPGTVTLRCFGHEIEFLSRTLVVDRRQVPWTAAARLVIHATNAAPAEPVVPAVHPP